MLSKARPAPTVLDRVLEIHEAALGEDTTTTMFADLHMHSTVSDGSDDSEQIVIKAKQAGLTHIAFTNHDTVVGVGELPALSKRYDIGIIGGVEISAWDCDARSNVHILGYGFTSEHAPTINALCEPLLKRRRNNSLWQMQVLLDSGYTVDIEAALRAASGSTCLYKQHIMAAMTDAPHGSESYAALYRSVFKGGGICDREIAYVDVIEAVRAIKEDGGLAVLAHPGQFDNYALVKALVAAGLDGIEKYHPLHTSHDHDIVDQLAVEHGLFVTGGSDYHGAYGKIKSPGDTRIEVSVDDALHKILQEMCG